MEKKNNTFAFEFLYCCSEREDFGLEAFLSKIFIVFCENIIELVSGYYLLSSTHTVFLFVCNSYRDFGKFIFLFQDLIKKH